LEEQTIHARLILQTEQSQAYMLTECCIASGGIVCCLNRLLTEKLHCVKKTVT